MNSLRSLAVLVIPAALAGGPALAQQTPTRLATNTTTTAPATTGVVQEGRLEMTHGGWRSSKIVGADVYNDQNNSIGTIEDLIVDKDGKITDAVISVGGFLGIGTKLVAVPFDQLKFETQTENNAPANVATNAGNVPTTAEANSAKAVAPAAPVPVPSNETRTAANTPPAVGTAATPVMPTGLVPAPGTMTAAPMAPRAEATERTRIVLPGATKQSLKSEPEFKYQTT
jgi:sporulation protein YlmC with PRC-barrel domain